MNPVVEYARSIVKQRGFVSASELIAFVIPEAIKKEWNDSASFLRYVADGINYHRVEYTNGMVETYRVKDLFYYMPRG